MSTALDFSDLLGRADQIREEFYAEKAKVDTLLEEVKRLCDNTLILKFQKKSVVRSKIRPVKTGVCNK